MTREQAKELLKREQERLKAIEHFANGGEVEWSFIGDEGEWRWESRPDFDPTVNWRPAPEPKYRPWQNAKEAIGAVGCMTRVVRGLVNAELTAVLSNGVYLGENKFYGFDEIFDLREITYDNGKTWVPCGVKE